MALILDAGALIAVDRGEARMLSILAAAQSKQIPVRVPTAVVAQVWRNGQRQARLAQFLAGMAEVPLDVARSRSVGLLLSASRTADVIDAAVLDAATAGDTIITSDPRDIAHLAVSITRPVRIVTASAGDR